jgi:two-component system chemotaxis sensor kinase CheA
MGEMDDVVREFLVESHEGLDRLDRDLLALEQRPKDRELLAGVFRCIHTIKGTCGFLGFSRLESVSHAGETLLSLLRDGALDLTPEITSALLSLVDAVRSILASIEAAGAESQDDHAALIERLDRLASPGAPVVSPVPSAASPESPIPAPIGGGSSDVSDASIRVDVGLLDRLMNLVGELVLARNQILQLGATTRDPALHAGSQRLDLITSALQEGVMKTRMQPVGNVWSRFPRVVRDLSVACRKQVRVEMEGQETELDRSIVEAIKDPLTHIVRNAVDHGIERPEVRMAAGKPAAGRLLLRAYHEGGQVNIEISDDGAGIDPERIRRKAVERELITADEAARLTSREALDLIFAPGFSTAEAVTNLSGRGVGMDVVRTNIEKVGGTVDIHSDPGRGTTLNIRIPLTLAIIPALIVGIGADRFAIPQASLLELVRLEDDDVRGRIESVYDAPVYRLRGELLPLVRLDRALGFDARESEEASVNIVVLQAGDRRFGLLVDRIHDAEEIVVKPLGRQLQGIGALAGATIMGDGTVALILDVLGLAQHAGVAPSSKERPRGGILAAACDAHEGRQALLVVGHGERRRVAIPLALVSRLEEIPASRIEWTGQGEVVQYRGTILPLVRLSSVLGSDGGAPRDPMHVVVYAEGGKCIGLVVDHILDIVEETLAVSKRAVPAALYGSAVVHQRVTELLNVDAIGRAMGAPDGAGLLAGTGS